MSYATEYLADLYREFGDEWKGTEEEAARVIGKLRGQKIEAEPESAKTLYDRVREDIAEVETLSVFVHDWRPYYQNPYLTITEYDSNRRQEFDDFPDEYRHPFAALIEYDATALELADAVDFGERKDGALEMLARITGRDVK